MIRFACPSCQKVLQAPDDRAGSSVACPGCRRSLQIPAPAGAARVPAAVGAGAGDWVYMVGGQKQGPVSQRELQQLAGTGQLQPTDKVWKQGMPRAVEARSVPGLFNGIQTAPSAGFEFHDGANGNGVARRTGGVKAPLWKRFMGECLAIVGATFAQTVRPISYFFDIVRRKSLGRKAEDAKLELGQRMYEAGMGDKPRRAKIQTLGERIVNIQAVKGDYKAPAAERRALLLQLGDAAIDKEAVPAEIESEHGRARAAKAKVGAVEQRMKGAMGGLLPSTGAGWRRIILGYGFSFCVLAIFGFLFLSHMNEQSRIRDEQAKVQAKKDEEAAKQKKIEEDADRKKDPEEIVAMCGPSVALIRFKEGERAGGGTGWMIRPGIMATNAHVMGGSLIKQFTIKYPSSKAHDKTEFKGEILHFDRKRDLAFVAITPNGSGAPPPPPPLRLAPKFEFRGGMAITVIGCPAVGGEQLNNAVSTGVLSTETTVYKQPYYQMGIGINPGNSGGPVFDSRGQVIGVVTLKASRQENIAYCIPLNDIKQAIEGLEKKDTRKAIEEATARHTLFVVVDRLTDVAGIYLQGIQVYVNTMRLAAANGIPVDQALAQARRQLDARFKLIDRDFMTDEIKTLGAKLKTDTNVPADVRAVYNEIWKSYEDIKNHFEKPSGTFQSYAQKSQQLQSQYGTQARKILKMLGLDLGDEEEKN